MKQEDNIQKSILTFTLLSFLGVLAVLLKIGAGKGFYMVLA